MKKRGNLYILITALLWSTSGLFFKSIIGSPVAINGARSIIALGVFLVYENRNFRIRTNKLVWVAAFCLALTNALYLLAAQLSTTSNAITLQYIAPVFVMVWTSIYTHTMPKKVHILSILLALSGVVIYFSDGLQTGYLLGNIFAVLAGLFFSGVFFLNTLPGSSSTDASKLGFILSFLIGLPFYSTLDITNMTSNLSLLGLGVFQVGLAYVFYAQGIKRTDAISASLISLMEIVFNPIWSFIAYGDMVTYKAVIGSILIMIAVALISITSTKSDSNCEKELLQ